MRKHIVATNRIICICDIKSCSSLVLVDVSEELTASVIESMIIALVTQALSTTETSVNIHLLVEMVPVVLLQLVSKMSRCCEKYDRQARTRPYCVIM